ncbi:MAG: DUF4350 domain-containing protein [Cyanobacteria bacterium P01_A01_bin.37]
MTQHSPISRKRLWIIGGVVILGMLLLTLIPSPGSYSRLSGSTYSRNPDGYSAWYEYMGDRGTPLTRWQQPFDELSISESDSDGITLVRVDEGFDRGNLWDGEENWLRRGNRLILIGYRGHVTNAMFRTRIAHRFGDMTIETRRRHQPQYDNTTVLLQDDAGVLVWKQQYGSGEVVFIVPPDFASNAYQSAPGNYAFLADVVAEAGDRLFIDEYSHGYKDSEVIEEEVAISWADYLVNTPLMLLLGQGVLILLLLIGANNRRSRPPAPLTSPEPNSSKAYINALASVLQKAESRDFVVSVIGREEQLHLQRRMGLGRELLEPNQLLSAWQQQTGQPAADLNHALRPYWQNKVLSHLELLTWLRSLQSIHATLDDHLPS